MKLLHAFLDRLAVGHRPPSGPLTTAEAAEAERSRDETLGEDDKPAAPREAAAGDVDDEDELLEEIDDEEHGGEA